MCATRCVIEFIYLVIPTSKVWGDYFMKTTFSVLLMAGLMTALSANAASKLTIICGPDNAEFTITIDSKTEISTSDGSELGGAYGADPARNSYSYTAFKIHPASQDGEQPDEIKINNDLLSGPGKTAPVWLAPGIMGGDFTCTSTEAK
jgi:hypothetical protein